MERSPSLTLTVFSIDHHGRTTIEGYGFLDLPKTPGSYNLEIKTWRPKLNQDQKLREFFLGSFSLNTLFLRRLHQTTRNQFALEKLLLIS